jgi:hypothetical protein
MGRALGLAGGLIEFRQGQRIEGALDRAASFRLEAHGGWE